MEALKKELDSKVTLDNLCDPEIVELSQKLDNQIVKEQKRLCKGVNKNWD